MYYRYPDCSIPGIPAYLGCGVATTMKTSCCVIRVYILRVPGRSYTNSVSAYCCPTAVLLLSYCCTVAVRLGPCCGRGVRLLRWILTRTPTVVVYHPPPSHYLSSIIYDSAVAVAVTVIFHRRLSSLYSSQVSQPLLYCVTAVFVVSFFIAGITMAGNIMTVGTLKST